MRLALAGAAAAVLAVSTPATAQMTATFLDGHYTMSHAACAKLKALEAGGPKSASTVPWYVERRGIGFWEGSCGYRRITERKKGQEWVVVAMCHEGPTKTRETYRWVRKGDGVYDVTRKGDRKPVRYTRCDLGKGK